MFPPPGDHGMELPAARQATTSPWPRDRDEVLQDPADCEFVRAVRRHQEARAELLREVLADDAVRGSLRFRTDVDHVVADSQSAAVSSSQVAPPALDRRALRREHSTVRV